MLGVSRTTIHRLIKSGVIIAPEANALLKRPRRILLKRQQVEALLKRGSDER